MALSPGELAIDVAEHDQPITAAESGPIPFDVVELLAEQIAGERQAGAPARRADRRPEQEALSAACAAGPAGIDTPERTVGNMRPSADHRPP
jgi:hypothetical protein